MLFYIICLHVWLLQLLFIQLRLVARDKLLSHILYVLLVFFVCNLFCLQPLLALFPNLQAGVHNIASCLHEVYSTSVLYRNTACKEALE